MLDVRIRKLLLEYYNVRNKCGISKKEKILFKKYDDTFHELRYQFNKLFSLGECDYEHEVNEIFSSIEKNEMVLIAILEELIEIAK